MMATLILTRDELIKDLKKMSKNRKFIFSQRKILRWKLPPIITIVTMEAI